MTYNASEHANILFYYSQVTDQILKGKPIFSSFSTYTLLVYKSNNYLVTNVMTSWMMSPFI